MSIQQDVLDCIGPGGIGAKELRSRMGNVPQNELDVCTGALVRSRKITLAFGRFELGPGKRAIALPTAAEEAAASLQPSKRVCKSCRVPKAVCEFRLTSEANDRADECNTCHGKKTRAGQIKAAAIRVTAPVVERREPATIECSTSPGCDEPTPEPRNAGGASALPPAASRQPVIGDHVIQRIAAECTKATEEIARQEASIEALHQEITVRRVEITHQRELREERESFLALYAKFAARAVGL